MRDRASLSVNTLRFPALWVILLSAVLLFAAIGRADLYNPDEPREAEMAREMWVSGDLLVPRLNGEPFLEKPPLFYWLVTAAYRVAGGPGEAAARAVPALSGLLVVLLTFLMARSLLDEQAALLAALVLLTSFEFFWIARRTMIDMPLTLAVLLACMALHRGITGRGRSRLAWLALGYAATGAAVMFKGIIGAGIPALALISWLLARRDWRGLLRHALLPGALLALVPVGLWVMRLQARLGDEAVREFVLVNNVLRFTGGAAKGHDNPFYYYIPTLLTDFAPWSLVLPLALAAAWRAARRLGPARDLLLWFAVPLLVLSLASTKRGIYLLPIYPPAAMLVGAWISRAATSKASRRTLWLLLAVAVAYAASIPALLHVARRADFMTPLLLAALLILPGVAAFRALRRADVTGLALGVVGLLGLAHLGLMGALVPAIVNGGTSARAAGGQLRSMAEAGDRIAIYQFREGMLGGFLFYAGRTFPNLWDAKSLERHLESGGPAPGPRPFVLMRAPVVAEVTPALSFDLAEARRYTPPRLPWIEPGRNDYVILTRGHDVRHP